MKRVSISASSALAARAAATVADAGGNAVDAALAATVVSITTEPGIVAPGGGAFITVWPPDADPVVIDAYAAMPATADAAMGWGDRIHMDYGGGMETLVGPASVAVPGAWAGMGMASSRFGELDWAALMQPAIGAAESGFPVPGVSEAYLSYAHEPIFDRDPESYAALHHSDGSRVAEGDIIRIAGLGESLRTIAAEGPESFYTGTIGKALAKLMSEAGGHVTADDLASYEPMARRPITVGLDGWTVASNPGPAVGGAVLVALLMLFEAAGIEGWSEDGTRLIAEVQRAVLGYRARNLDVATERVEAVERLLAAAATGDRSRLLASPSTVNVSTVDNSGLACAMTTSAGYGSGIMIPGTGLWLNNNLGEVELHPDEGIEALGPGMRLPSNMAPTVARREDGAALAVGSPGASRITTSLAQVLFNFIHLGMSVTEAVAHPRLHVEVFDGKPTIAFEPGIPVRAFDDFELRRFPDLSMYFGGVGFALWDPSAGLFESADPRRTGDVARGGV